MRVGNILISLVLVTTVSKSYSASLGFYCFLKDVGQAGGNIQGFNTTKKLPIASVSKLMTTWWGLKSKSLDYRFETRVHITPISKDLYDLHFEGSLDPYFGKENLHYTISELNKLGIKQIRNLSFDENFKFYWNVQSKYVAIGHYDLTGPSVETVRSELNSHTDLTSEYSTTSKIAKELFGIELVAKPVFKVKKITIQSRNTFHPGIETKSYSFRSAQLLTLVKEMNRNSNNHAANSIFQHLGGATEFSPYIEKQLGLGQDKINFVNGSGDRLDTPEGSKYNEASCEAVVRTVQDLHYELEKNGRGIENAVAVVGGDLESTTDNIYINDETDLTVIAKTGTVNPAITLAGMVSTKSGDYFFAYNMKTDGTKSDWSSARQKIGIELTKKIKEFSGGDPIEYTQIRFLSFDKGSAFTNVPAESIP